MRFSRGMRLFSGVSPLPAAVDLAEKWRNLWGHSLTHHESYDVGVGRKGLWELTLLSCSPNFIIVVSVTYLLGPSPYEDLRGPSQVYCVTVAGQS